MRNSIALSATFLLSVAVPALAQTEQDSAQQQMFRVTITNTAEAPLNTSEGPVPFTLSPGVWAVHTGVNPLFVPFERVQGLRGEGLENLAEDGKPLDPLVTALREQSGIEAVGIFNMPESAMEKGGLKPGTRYEFTVPGDPGDQLSLATMFAESNDLFYAPYGIGIPLFIDGKPISGEVTSMVALWDAGTEENQEPGVGPDQPHRSAIGAGPKENKPVRPISYVEDPYEYPQTTKVIKIMVEPITQVSAAGLYGKWAGEDGNLTVEEWDAAVDARFGERAVDLTVAEWDPNADGMITREEFEKAAAESELLRTQSK